MSEKSRRRRLVSPPPAPGERLIRKYGNRRLYDTHDSHYVTLEDLVEVFASEEDVRVVDAVNGEDITKKVLAQAILFEEDRRKTQIIPLELLRALLRQRGEAADDVYQRRMAKALSDITRGKIKAPAPGAADEKASELDELRRRLKALEKQIHRK